MKRTFKRPDGTEETVEGTAEELAAYEKALRENTPAAPTNEGQKKPEVLRGNSEIVDQLQRLAKQVEELQRSKFVSPYGPPWGGPPTCWQCGKENCTEQHIAFPFPTAIYSAST